MMLRAALPTLILAGGVLTFAALARADHEHHQPPTEAVTACASHAEGDACQVTFHEHTMTGTCKKGPDATATALACMPDHPPGPPKAAVDACQGKAAGDVCTATGRDGAAHDGTCRSARDGKGPLACGHPHP